MAWWYGQQDSTKGAWDVDLKEHTKYKSRKAGLKILIRGLICLALYISLLFVFASIAEYAENVENTLILKLLNISSFGLAILGIASLQIPIGIYYFIKYFKIKNNETSS